ncbi:glycosyltransferase family 1 protein [uncultured Spirosoma sp.]|uniref:glycosyltransferase family 4 protein n=1 Tax=uncultured Spirosoma sp. TaxID=278208 RepID=UPI0025860A97|nr:glycosyltransferase family 1 protein [uncultured Spirosoma sp.]
MKICIDARMVNNSGIGVYVKKYVSALLLDNQLEVTLIGVKNDLLKIFDSKHATYIDASFPIYSIYEQLILPFIIPSCDVFWSPHYNIPFITPRAKKHLVTIPDIYHLANIDTLKFHQRFYARFVTKFATTKADKLITISEFSKKEITKYIRVDEKKISVVYLGIDKVKFRKITSENIINRTKIAYNLPEEFILYVGNIKPNKNLRRLVEAFETILNDFPSVMLVITGKKNGFINGDPALFNYINSNNRLLSRIVFTGFVEDEDLPTLYSLAKLFVFPSTYEGFGFPPLEAMACECVTVVSSASSIPEVCGEASYYVNPFKPSEIADGIRTMLSNPELRESSLQLGKLNLKRFSWNTSITEFVEILKNI